MMNLKLYEVSEILRQALDELTDNTEIPIEAIRDTLEGLDGAFNDKALSVAGYIRNLELEQEAVESCLKQMDARKKSIESKIKGLKSYLLEQMQIVGKSELKSNQLTVKVRKNPPSVNVVSETDIPKEYFIAKTVVSLSKTTVLDALKSGVTVPGCELKTDSKRLEIK